MILGGGGGIDTWLMNVLHQMVPGSIVAYMVLVLLYPSDWNIAIG